MKKLLKIWWIAFLIHCLTSAFHTNAKDLNPGTAFVFKENKGQLRDSKGNECRDILFYYDMKGTTVYFSENKISYVLKKAINKTNSSVSPYLKENIMEACRVDMVFENKCSFSGVQPIAEMDDYLNFYHGPSTEILNVKQYKTLLYKNIYPFIDVLFYSDDQMGLKYDFIVNPGGNPKEIKLRFEGAEKVHLEDRGRLIITTPVGTLQESLPAVFQNLNLKGKAVKQNVEARYELNENKIHFVVSGYDRSATLVIDPWATFIGGNDPDESKSIAAGNSGNTYVTGYTQSIDFPASPGALQDSGKGNYDAYVIKLDSTGNRLWATYYGGTGNDFAQQIKTNSSGSPLICGYSTSTDLYVSASGVFQSSNAGSYDVFLLKLNDSGAFEWASYFGGTGGELAFALNIDFVGNIVFGGFSSGNDLPVTAGAFQSTNNGALDAFIAKFNSSGNRIWSTYYGGSGSEDAHTLTTDKKGNILFAGDTYSSDFPVSPGAFQANKAGANDFYMVKLDSAGNRKWATYYGGTAPDDAYGIVTDAASNIFITGVTESMDFPLAGVPYQDTLAGGKDAFYIKMTEDGKPVWSTYFGGSGDDAGTGLAFNSSVFFYGCGNTTSNDLPVFGNALQVAATGSNDVFYTCLDSSGSFYLSSYFGDSLNDHASSITIDQNYRVSVCGNTYSPGFPATAGVFQPNYIGNGDAFVFQYDGAKGIPIKAEALNCDTVLAMELFPNPAEHNVTISWDASMNKNCRIRITDISGKEILPQHPLIMEATSLSFNIENLDPGIYFIAIFNETGLIRSGKLVKL